MPPTKRRYSIGRKLLIGLVIFILIVGIAFQVFINSYITPIVRERITSIIVKGSDSLYSIQMGKLSTSFWGGAIRFADVHITTDSARYAMMEENKDLPGMTFNLHLKEGSIEGIGLWDLIRNKTVDIEMIDFREADVKLARHFRQTEPTAATGEPLWKLIQPDIKSIMIKKVQFGNLNVEYQNVDSAKSFRWEFAKCNAIFSGIRVDSTGAAETSRLLFAEDIALTAKDIAMKTPDGLYALNAESVYYSSSKRTMEANKFSFSPAVSQLQFMKRFGHQQEIYTLNFPVIKATNFQLPQWIGYNRLVMDTVELKSPNILLHMDRNAPPNPNSKMGKYPHQLLSKAPITIKIKRVLATDATVTYSEKNDKNKLTGRLVFSGLRGTIDNVTNDTTMLQRSAECLINVNSTMMKSGKINAFFRLNLVDPNGAFQVKATVTNLDGPQLKPLFRAMTSTDLQSFNMQRLEYSMNGNDRTATADLKMRYTDMDILINTVDGDKSLNKQGFLSFLANRLALYKENPMEGKEERVAVNVPGTRDPMKSFFNFIWKTLYGAAGEIVLRPVAQRKIEKRQEKAKKKGKK